MKIYLNKSKTALIIPKKDMQKIYRDMRKAKPGDYITTFRCDNSGICFWVEKWLDNQLECHFPSINNGIFRSHAHLVTYVNSAFLKSMKSGFATWKHFSGNSSYPINLTALHPEDEFHRRKNQWTGKYGKARLSLLKHLEETTSHLSIPLRHIW